jgi:hypothetical protein
MDAARMTHVERDAKDWFPLPFTVVVLKLSLLSHT